MNRLFETSSQSSHCKVVSIAAISVGIGEIASLRPENHAVQGFVRNDRICIGILIDTNRSMSY